MGVLVGGAVALESVAVGKGQFYGFECGVRGDDESGGEDKGAFAIVVFVGKYAAVESFAISGGEEMIVKEFDAERSMMYYKLYYKEER